jgi:hypothetical protein
MIVADQLAIVYNQTYESEGQTILEDLQMKRQALSLAPVFLRLPRLALCFKPYQYLAAFYRCVSISKKEKSKIINILCRCKSF